MDNNNLFQPAVIPNSIEAEQSVLGAVLIKSSVLSIVLDKIKSDYFYNQQHKAIFEVMISLFTSGRKADVITVAHATVQEKIFENSQEANEYLAALMNKVPSISNVESYCDILAEKYYARSLLDVANTIISDITNGSYNSQNLLDSAEQSIFDIRQGKDVKGLTHIKNVIYESYEHLAKITGPDKDKYLGARTGFHYLDAITTGLNKSDLILIGARPAMGKTAFALNIATNVAKKSGKDVAVFSLEMSKEQLATRMLSTEALVDSNKLRSGFLNSDDWIRLASSAERLCRISMYIDDTAGITVPQLKSKLRRMKNLGLVVIDYLQLMSSAIKSDNRVVIISEITRQLKIMAKELDVPVILLSQLSRESDKRTDKRPMLSDLRESGSIEQDADIVLFLYRDAYYNKDSEEINISECIVAKNRHGETGTVKLGWDGQYTRFSNLETQGQ
ncbi:MAG: replicative DNA helicase [Oscillospiraceae bacterium]